MMSGKVAKIHPDLFKARNIFNEKISSIVGSRISKVKTDKILANAIENDFFEFDIVTKKGKKMEFKW